MPVCGPSQLFFSSKESKFIFRKWPTCGETGEPTLKDLALQWLPGAGFYRQKSLIMVTMGVRVVVRVVVSTDCSARG